MTNVVVPNDLWDEDIEGVLLSWIFDDGAQVQAGDVIVEIMVEKVQRELAAPGSGVLRHKVAEESLIRRGDVIGVIE